MSETSLQRAQSRVADLHARQHAALLPLQQVERVARGREPDRSMRWLDQRRAASMIQETFRRKQHALEEKELRWTHPEYALGAQSRNIRYRGVMPPGSGATSPPRSKARQMRFVQDGPKASQNAHPHCPNAHPTMNLWQDGKWRLRQTLPVRQVDLHQATVLRRDVASKRQEEGNRNNLEPIVCYHDKAADEMNRQGRRNPWLSSAASAAGREPPGYLAATRASDARGGGGGGSGHAETPRGSGAHCGGGTPRYSTTPRYSSTSRHSTTPRGTSSASMQGSRSAPALLDTPREPAPSRHVRWCAYLGSSTPRPSRLYSRPATAPGYHPTSEARRRFAWPSTTRAPPTQPNMPERQARNLAWAREQEELGDCAHGSSFMLRARRKEAWPLPSHIAPHYGLMPSGFGNQIDYRWCGGSANDNRAGRDPSSYLLVA